jgi:hypothetical protein
MPPMDIGVVCARYFVSFCGQQERYLFKLAFSGKSPSAVPLRATQNLSLQFKKPFCLYVFSVRGIPVHRPHFCRRFILLRRGFLQYMHCCNRPPRRARDLPRGWVWTFPDTCVILPNSPNQRPPVETVV